MELFVRIVNGFQSLTIFLKRLHLRCSTGFWIYIWNLDNHWFSHMSKYSQGCSSYFFPMLHFSVLANFWAIFYGSDKFPAVFLGLPIFISHTWILWMKNTQYWITQNNNSFSYLWQTISASLMTQRFLRRIQKS